MMPLTMMLMICRRVRSGVYPQPHERMRQLSWPSELLHHLWGPRDLWGPNREDVAPFSWEDHVRRLSYAEYKECYRLTPLALDELCDEIHSEHEADMCADFPVSRSV